MDISYMRLHNQHIKCASQKTPEEVVRHLGAIQAQDYANALWAIGQRTKSATVEDVERAIEAGKIVRTWPMRGTIHFIPAEDAKWMLKLSAERMLKLDSRRMDRLELTEENMEQCKQLFYDELSGGKRLTRPQMLNLLEESGISTKNQRGYHILWYTSIIGLICQGPVQDKQPTFVLLDEWIPNSKALSKEESLATFAKKYFPSHGPATLHDFAWWSGLTMKDARLALELAKPELISQEIDGIEYWMGEGTLDLQTTHQSSVHLLPAYDEYLTGYKDRSAVLTKEHATKIVPGNNGIFLPTLVIDGQVVGIWKRKLKKNAVEITLHPFMQIDGLEEKVVEEVEKYRKYLGFQ